MESVSPIKFLGSIYLYNMLQDFRHLLIFDFREDFQQAHIRDSFHVYPRLNRQQILEVIDRAEKKANQKEEKYKNIQRVRRYFFINKGKLDPAYEGVNFVIKCLNQRKSKEDKFYSLSDSFETFYGKYPFMFLVQKQLQKEVSNKIEFDRKLLYPYAKFPAEIIQDKLFLGGIYSSNSQKQLTDLGIKSLVDFVDYNIQQKMADFKRQYPNFTHIPINKDIQVIIDFDIINKQIDEALQKGRTLLYCADGQSISPAFAISYLICSNGYFEGLPGNIKSVDKQNDLYSASDLQAKEMIVDLLLYQLSNKMNRGHSASKHLYTLNDSKISDQEENSSVNSSLSESDMVEVIDRSDNQKQTQRIMKKNQELSKIVADLQLKNQQLYQLNQLSEKRNQKHEQKQRDLIKKLSYFQVNNKQLSYEVRKMAQDMEQTRQNKKMSQGQMSEVKQTIKKSLYEKEKFILFLKNLLQILRKCDKPDDFAQQRDKIIAFLQKNIANSQNNHKINCEFDLKFEMSRVDTLKQKIKSLQQEIQQSKGTIQRQKNEKKKLINTYNDKISKLRQLYDSLRDKIQHQQQESKRKIKNIILQKNQIIQSLKNKLRESRTRKNSMDIKKSRQSKKSFIGDGDLSHLQLNELNEAIEHLQMQIIKEFQQ